MELKKWEPELFSDDSEQKVKTMPAVSLGVAIDTKVEHLYR